MVDREGEFQNDAPPQGSSRQVVHVSNVTRYRDDVDDGGVHIYHHHPQQHRHDPHQIHIQTQQTSPQITAVIVAIVDYAVRPIAVVMKFAPIVTRLLAHRVAGQMKPQKKGGYEV